MAAPNPAARRSVPESESAVVAPVRGSKTRRALLSAARTIFERDGFLDAKVVDITVEAGVATGSFYTHFSDKLEVFRALVAEINDETLHAVVESNADERLEDRIRRSNRTYFENYRRNARLMALFEEMSLIDDDFRQIRTARAKSFSARTAKLIAQQQAAGAIRADLDPVLLADSLSAMVSRMAQLTHVWGADTDEEMLNETVTYIWLAALGLDSGPARD